MKANGLPEELETPMMRQYLEIKKQYQEEILFFRMGDFYEMFLEDAIYASRVLQIALTKRQDKIPMCGIPYHAAASYIHRLLKSGRKIAICEQIEDKNQATGKLLQRQVVRILTPGSLYEEELLDKESRISLCAYHKNICAICDLSTGEIFLLEVLAQDLGAIFEKYGTKEIILSEDLSLNYPNLVFVKRPLRAYSDKILEEGFGIKNIAVLELKESEKEVLSLLLLYLQEINPAKKIFFRIPQKLFSKKQMFLDEACLKTLEILHDQSGNRSFSLFGILDKTQTPGGKRLLQAWLASPSLELSVIQERHNMVEFFCKERHFKDFFLEKLKTTYDLSRLLQQLHHRPQVRHLGEIFQTLEAIFSIIEALKNKENLPATLTKILKISFPTHIFEELQKALWMDNLPPLLDERRFVRFGYSPELDEVFYLSESAQTILRNLEEKARKEYDLPNLKIRYNKIIGYYFEIPKGQLSRVPPHFIRRQTLTTAERFTTEELQNLESRLLSAQEDILRLQTEIFQKLVSLVLENQEILQNWADVLSELDVLLSFAEVALRNNYIRPIMDEGHELYLKDSRHPVVEKIFQEEVFVPNDCHLNKENHLAIITGPNMAGKSTYIRQVGLIVIMAHAGSFVPANFAKIPLTDRVFTRIGAYDRLARGESTFFVEMAECARIFANFTERSLILLDEVGRGTSTYDGISIARAMIEYLNSDEAKKPKTLFATHYAELAEMIAPEKGIVGLTVRVEEQDGKIIFLRKIIPGTQSKSYGIHVAELAGMPKEIVERAKELLAELEKEGFWQKEPVFRSMGKRSLKDQNQQFLFFE